MQQQADDMAEPTTDELRALLGRFTLELMNGGQILVPIQSLRALVVAASATERWRRRYDEAEQQLENLQAKAAGVVPAAGIAAQAGIR